MPIDRKHLDQVEAECARLIDLIEKWRGAQGTYTSPLNGRELPLDTPRQSGSIRHQSMLLTRALADLRRPG